MSSTAKGKNQQLFPFDESTRFVSGKEKRQARAVASVPRAETTAFIPVRPKSPSPLPLPAKPAPAREPIEPSLTEIPPRPPIVILKPGPITRRREPVSAVAGARASGEFTVAFEREPQERLGRDAGMWESWSQEFASVYQDFKLLSPRQQNLLSAGLGAVIALAAAVCIALAPSKLPGSHGPTAHSRIHARVHNAVAPKARAEMPARPHAPPHKSAEGAWVPKSVAGLSPYDSAPPPPLPSFR